MRWRCLLFPIVFLLSLNVQAALYKWVDANGKVQYSDKPPAERPTRGVSKMSPQGTITKKAESDAERQARLEQEAQHQKELDAKNLQARWDQILLENNISVKDIESKRDKNLAVYVPAIQALEEYRKDLRNDLAQLQKEQRTYPANAVPQNLKTRINQTQVLIQGSEVQLKLKNEELRKIKLRYAQDIGRYKVLKGLP